MKLKIRKGAQVKVLAGADKGKKGEVIEVNPKTMKLKVAGVRVATHFDKKDGIKKLESFIDYSNVMLLEKAPDSKGKKTAKKKTASKNA